MVRNGHSLAAGSIDALAPYSLHEQRILRLEGESRDIAVEVAGCRSDVSNLKEDVAAVDHKLDDLAERLEARWDRLDDRLNSFTAAMTKSAQDAAPLAAKVEALEGVNAKVKGVAIWALKAAVPVCLAVAAALVLDDKSQALAFLQAILGVVGSQ